jgi:hypothetical protein
MCYLRIVLKEICSGSVYALACKGKRNENRKTCKSISQPLWLKYGLLPKADTNENGVWELVDYHPSCPIVVSVIYIK